MRLAIVGAGVGGLSVLAELSLKYQCEVYEETETVGGVWNTSYQNQIQLQIEPRIYRFPTDTKYPRSRDGLDVQRYLEDYVNRQGLSRFIKFNTRIIDVQLLKDGYWLRVLTVKGGDLAKSHLEGPYRWVVCTGTARRPTIPSFVLKTPVLQRTPILHTGDLTNSLINRIHHQHIVVYGGSKSAAEAVLRLYTNNHVIWVARNFNSFVKRTKNTTVSYRRVLGCTLKQQPLKDCIAECRVHPGQPLRGGSVNTLTDREAQILQHQVVTVQATITAMNIDQVWLSNKTQLPCNLLILGTGYQPSQCPGYGKYPGVIRLKPPDSDIRNFAAFSHFNLYSILACKLNRYLSNQVLQYQTFQTYVKKQHSLRDLCYTLEYYFRFTFQPSSQMVSYNNYHRDRQIVWSLIVLFILLASVIYWKFT